MYENQNVNNFNNYSNVSGTYQTSATEPEMRLNTQPNQSTAPKKKGGGRQIF